MIPSRWPDMELWALTYLRPLVAGVTFGNELPELEGAFKHVLVTAVPGQRVTPITQVVRFDFEIRAMRAAGSLDIAEAFRIATDIAFHLESAPRDGDPIVFAEKDTGPNRVTDGPGVGGDAVFTEMSVYAEVHRV